MNRAGLAACLLLAGSVGMQRAGAVGDTRTINLHHVHTDESLTITFKKDGQYDEEALKKINWIMRDWRKNEATTMDREEIDLLWQVYQEVGAKEPIEIICGYRSPTTNNMLRSRSAKSGGSHGLPDWTGSGLPFQPLLRHAAYADNLQRWWASERFQLRVLDHPCRRRFHSGAGLRLRAEHCSPRLSGSDRPQPSVRECLPGMHGGPGHPAVS